MKKILYFVSAVVIASSAVSCKSYFDINYDPNLPASENITTDMIFPGIEAALATSYGDFYRITGGYFSQQYGHLFGTSNYLDYSQFQMSATRSNTHYVQLFQKVLVNAKNVSEKAQAEEDWGTNLAAITLRAFAYQILVDCYGEIPYTEALDDTVLNPAYDDGLTVYQGIVSELDEALAKASAGQKVCKSLLFPNGDSSDWIRLANSVKLKILSRMSGATDVSSQIGALISNGNFITEDAQFAGCWSDADGQYSPFYSEEFKPGMQFNVCANVAIIGTMLVKNSDGDVVYQDPRLAKYFAKNNQGAYIGSISGTNFATTAPAPYNNAAGFCRPIVTATTPVAVLSVSEVEFFIAEYYAKSGSASQAAEHYAKAVEASFASNGVSGADGFIAQWPYDNANYAKSIGIAKWIALAGSNNFEAWCEVRRLGYPAFGSVKGSDMWNGSNAVDVSAYEAGTLYTPFDRFAEVGDNALIARWPYANSSQTRNSSVPAFPGYTSKVFWAK
ncbi:MAG: SusD/RagB family nutrient-binding outer membrane lipoprotein [Bacteroidales bacterium]|nr:SusD/RagB family nutrient-binding outer membrane lipoprotein [Bacteroidales bacterium]